MTFKDALKRTPHLEDAWKAGLGAMRSQDRPHINPETTRNLSGSAYVDEALKQVAEHANAHRWDFAIAYKHTNPKKEWIYWVEIHTASDSEVNVVLEKLKWLKAWLAGEGSALNHFDREFIWVSSGATSFTLNSPQQKRFAALGLQHRGRRLRIQDARTS